MTHCNSGEKVTFAYRGPVIFFCFVLTPLSMENIMSYNEPLKLSDGWHSLFSSEIMLTTVIFYVTGPSELENPFSLFINNGELCKAFRQSIIQSFLSNLTLVNSWNCDLLSYNEEHNDCY